MRVFDTLSQLREAVGEDLGVSEWLCVDQDRIDRFAEATGDHQWIHTSPERAATGPFGKIIAHGYLTLSLLPVLVQQIYAIRNTVMGVNYGLNRVRFITPVKVGARIRGHSVLLSSTDLEGGGVQIGLRTTVEIDHESKPACVAETVSRYYQ